MKTHNSNALVPNPFNFPEPTFKKNEDSHFEHCSYCGSVSVEVVLQLMQKSGTKYSGSDWKYGWPHKFYITAQIPPTRKRVSSTWHMGEMIEETYADVTTESLKFYSEHLEDATPEQIEEWNRIVAPLLGVEFTLDEKGLRWKAVLGYQASGIVK